MLWSRSASLMTSTLMSRAIATIILRIVSACAESPYLTLSSLVTPSTSWATSSPKSWRTCSSVYGVSSTVSCSSDAASGGAVHDTAARVDQVGGGADGAAGGQHVVDQQHPLARSDRVLVHLERRVAV